MADASSLKVNVQHEIDEIALLLIECSDWMVDNPEIGLEEYQASAKLSGMLEGSSASVERGIAGLPTAFRATLPGSSPGGPASALLAEYDAPSAGCWSQLRAQYHWECRDWRWYGALSFGQPAR